MSRDGAAAPRGQIRRNCDATLRLLPCSTLNASNLETLGPAKLAALLLEVSKGNAASKRRLRLALAEGQSADDAAREVSKRLKAIERPDLSYIR